MYSISNVCNQTLPIHTVVVVMLLTMSSNETEAKIAVDAQSSRNASSVLVGPPLLAVLHASAADLAFVNAPTSVGAGLQAEAVSVTVKSWIKVEHAGVGDQVGDWVGLSVGDVVGLSVGLVVGDAVGDVVGLVVGLVVGAWVGLVVGDWVGAEAVQIVCTGQSPATVKGRGPHTYGAGAGCVAGGVVL